MRAEMMPVEMAVKVTTTMSTPVAAKVTATMSTPGAAIVSTAMSARMTTKMSTAMSAPAPFFSQRRGTGSGRQQNDDQRRYELVAF